MVGFFLGGRGVVKINCSKFQMFGIENYSVTQTLETHTNIYKIKVLQKQSQAGNTYIHIPRSHENASPSSLVFSFARTIRYY